MFLYLFLILIGVLVIWTIRINKNIAMRNLSGPISFPLVGSAPQILYQVFTTKNPVETKINIFRDYFNAFGESYFFSIMGNRDSITTMDPEVVRWITKDHFANYKRYIPKYLASDWPYQQAKHLLGNGIFIVDDDIWEFQRAVASPLFKKHSLDHMRQVFAEKAIDVVNKMQEYSKEGTVVDIQQIFMKYTLDSFGIIGFNLDFHSLDSKENEVGFPSHFDNAQYLLSEFFWNISKQYGPHPESYRNSVAYINKYIDDLIDGATKKNLEGEKDLLSTFLNMRDENGKPFDRKWIRDIVLNFTVAGRDTTALLMTWCIFCLMKNPEVEEKLRKEIDQFIETDDDIKDEKVMRNMKYFDNVLYETLRLYPSVPMTARISLEDDVLPNGMRISAGTVILYVQYFLHRNAKYWSDAEKFIPERFDDKDQFNSFQFTPFHAGPMQCLGRHMALIEAKMLLTTLLRKFKFSLVPNQNIIPYLGVTSPAYPGMKVTVDVV